MVAGTLAYFLYFQENYKFLQRCVLFFLQKWQKVVQWCLLEVFLAYGHLYSYLQTVYKGDQARVTELFIA